MNTYDTIIIGGGPGGSTAGTFLARAGQRVLILEKEFFPRFHIGESLLPFGNDVLKASGVWPKVQAGGFMTKLGAEFTTGNSSRFHRFWFARGLVPGYGQTFHVERSRFDDLLLKHAAEHGCDVKQGATVRTVRVDADGVSLSYACADNTCEVRARWVIDASGRDAFLGRALNLPREPIDIPKRAAVYAHFKGAYRNPGDAAGHITIIRLKDGWFWSIPLDTEKTSVGLVSTLEDFKAAGSSIETWFERTVAGSAELSKRLGQAERVSEFYTTTDYSYRYAVLAQPRVLLVGDAGGFIDPIFSSGVFIATKTGQMAAELIVKADAHRRALSSREQSGYTREVRRIGNIYFDMIRMYYDNASFEVFMHPQNNFKMVQTINSMLAGNTSRSFSMWLRVQMFRLVCWVNQRRQIVPPLNYADQTASSPVVTR